MADQFDHERQLAAFNQNHESFRSLNQQMWQIPLISMTLTGGLWFGVSAVGDFALFKVALLFLASVGNFVLIVVIHRLRFVMDGYLQWLAAFNANGFVRAEGSRWFQKGKVVRTSFQGMLALAGAISLALCLFVGFEALWEYKSKVTNMSKVEEYYRKHAESLADTYETVSTDETHPALIKIIENEFPGQKLRVLDVGAGTGRDAAWMAARGHHVTAIEPSSSMQTVGKKLHSNKQINWVADSLPKLELISAPSQNYDIILLSAVWMHLNPEDRKPALARLVSLLRPSGVLYITLRIGPDEADRGIHKVSAEELVSLTQSSGLIIEAVDQQEDLLGRKDVSWESFTIRVKK